MSVCSFAAAQQRKKEIRAQEREEQLNDARYQAVFAGLTVVMVGLLLVQATFTAQQAALNYFATLHNR